MCHFDGLKAHLLEATNNVATVVTQDSLPSSRLGTKDPREAGVPNIVDLFPTTTVLFPGKTSLRARTDEQPAYLISVSMSFMVIDFMQPTCSFC